MSANDIDKYGLIALYAANFDFDEMAVRRLIDKEVSRANSVF